MNYDFSKNIHTHTLIHITHTYTLHTHTHTRREGGRERATLQIISPNCVCMTHPFSVGNVTSNSVSGALEAAVSRVIDVLAFLTELPSNMVSVD